MDIPEINKRINQIIEYYANGVVTKFAEQINISQQTLNRLFVVDKRTGKYPVATTEILQRISEMYDVNTQWLLTGKGRMFLNDTKNPLNQSIVGNNNIHVGNNNKDVDLRQYYSDSPDVLRAQIEEKDILLYEKDERIKEKDAQIKEKDAQIKELLSILSKQK